MVRNFNPDSTDALCIITLTSPSIKKHSTVITSLPSIRKRKTLSYKPPHFPHTLSYPPYISGEVPRNQRRINSASKALAFHKIPNGNLWGYKLFIPDRVKIFLHFSSELLRECLNNTTLLATRKEIRIDDLYGLSVEIRTCSVFVYGTNEILLL